MRPSQFMEKLQNYRIGIRTQMSNELPNPIHEALSQSQKQSNLIGQKVLWQGEKENHTGKIIGFHGKNAL